MAATVLTLTAKTYDAALLDLTAMTGGNSLDIGYTGADWLHINNNTLWNDPSIRIRKEQGNEQILPSLVTFGGNPAPTTSNGSAQSNVFTADTGDRTTGSAIFSGGIGVNVSNTELGNGVQVTFPLSRDLKTFWWLGHSRNGTFDATATLSDASATVTPYSLPTAALNVQEPGWFEVTFRGTYWQVDAGVTVTIAITRTGGATASGQILCRPWVLLTPVPPSKPRGMPAGRR
jgi:hypothetical protein